MTVLETERLILRPWRVGDTADARALFTYASNPNVGPAASWRPHTNVEESAEIIRTVLNAPETYAVVLKRTDEPIGSIGLHQQPSESVINTPGYQPSDMEIGYWIGEPYWGQGLIPEAARALLRHGFEDLDLQAVWGTHNVENAKSSRVMDKLGLRLIRIQPHVRRELLGDVWRDQAIRRITREEWEAKVADALD